MSYYSVPSILIESTNELETNAINLLRSGRYEEAEAKYRELLRTYQEWEVKHGVRVHKGTPFHNLGLSLLYQGKSVDALKNLILAYIEDSIGAKSIGEPDNMLASRVLRGICGVGQEQLREIDGIVFKLKTIERLEKDRELHEDIFTKAKNVIDKVLSNYEKYLSNTWKIDVDGQRFLQDKAFSTAFKLYQHWFNLLLEYQEKVNMRVHKGTPLFNMGLSLFLIEDEKAKNSSKEWFLYAHIENALSSKLLDSIFSESSAMILKTQLGVDQTILKSLGEFAFDQKGAPISLNPREILEAYIDKNDANQMTLLLAHLPEDRNRKKLQIYQRLTNENDPNKKGQILVDLMTLIIGTDKNFAVGKVDVRTETEQIDMEIHNKALDPFLRQLNSMIIIVECKNWSKNVGSDEIREFAGKVENRPRVLCNVGLFITSSQFTEPAIKELLRHSGKNYLIATIDGNDLNQAVLSCSPFSEILKTSILSAGRR